MTATLVGSTAAHAAGGHSETSLLIYSERDRVRATEGNFSLTKPIKSDYTLNLRLTFDGLTGATPTGRSPSKYPQTLTRASGGKTITVPAGEFPVDEYFKDTRFAAEASLARPLGRKTTGSVGAAASSERDYKSIGVNGGLTREFNRNNTTLGLAAAYTRDVITPVGGFYEPFSVFGEELDEDRDDRLARFAGKSKRVTDLVFSLTQVLDRMTVVRMNFSRSHASGYQTDPYKIISVVQPPDSADAGEPTRDLYERRPDTRSKYAVYVELRRQIAGCATSIASRYFWDDWGIESYSIDLATRLGIGKRGALQPRLRWYRQAQADFYAPFLVDGRPLPEYASADGRLSQFYAITSGITWSVPVSERSYVNITTEYYLQRGDSSPPPEYGSQLTFDLFPKLDVVMLRLGYARDF